MKSVCIIENAPGCVFLIVSWLARFLQHAQTRKLIRVLIPVLEEVSREYKWFLEVGIYLLVY